MQTLKRSVMNPQNDLWQEFFIQLGFKVDRALESPVKIDASLLDVGVIAKIGFIPNI